MDNTYNPFDKMQFTYNNCFLCGSKDVSQKTLEHVFPKWLLKRFELWNKQIQLLNGTLISYRQLTIPCCNKCNNEYLSRIENKFRRAVDNGYDAFLNLDEETIFLWSAKILYGLLYKQLSLPFDRKSPRLGTITSPDLLEKYRILHLLLQGARYKTKYEGKPWSIFIFQSQEYKDERDFDYFDGLFSLVLGIRIGRVSFVICFEDAGIQKVMFEDYFRDLQEISLHPIQFKEIIAKVHYKQILFRKNPFFMVVEGKENDRTVLVNQPTGDLFDEWDFEDYSKILSLFFKPYGLHLKDIYHPPGKAISFLYGEEGEVKHIPK
ncbi:hypothetical protein [Bacillus subtilis]|uniref:hypothetical protein n=1 Tax=Bacillus subtilis TaxID=1423 RepID=UPI000D0241D7|nr:hypothetical protein [Bacillus subtilis]PRS91128.1 hypothetical protein C6349_16065 [Bacillus subtilis subsp. subtilis]PRS91511.1 hypothetical protein C6350_19255 [Bacillus subtilis subsp. subtilis]QHM12632.1 hypothetical protein C7M29_00240 [Bacillus subtilis]CAF1842208.1 hypothetical protein NRS6128_03746 [Bacillus subtilis]CAI6235779.1 hypothetical protein NRS6128_03620 [Bacillus subtilis]